jgi:hypothetical protein
MPSFCLPLPPFHLQFVTVGGITLPNYSSATRRMLTASTPELLAHLRSTTGSRRAVLLAVVPGAGPQSQDHAAASTIALTPVIEVAQPSSGASGRALQVGHCSSQSVSPSITWSVRVARVQNQHASKHGQSVSRSVSQPVRTALDPFMQSSRHSYTRSHLLFKNALSHLLTLALAAGVCRCSCG